MKARTFVILAIALAMVALAAFVVACDSGGGSSKSGDDDDSCEPADVGGSYPVTITWTEESCNEDVVGNSANGTLSIEQDGKKASIYFEEYGPGSQREKIFDGEVCGYTITGSIEEDVQLGEGVDCSSHRQSTYSLQLDPDTNQISGEFSGTYIWSGSDCEEYGITPNVQCTWKKSVEPYEP